MDNNRITIISPKDKRRKKKYNIIMFILLTIILGVSCIIGYSYYSQNTVSIPVTTTTKTTTKTTVTTTQEVTTTVTNNVVTNNYIYNYSLVNNDYKIYVCNEDYISRISTFKLYNKTILLGESNSTNGLLINKNKVDLTNKPILKIDINNKKYDAKYDSRC